MADNTTTYTAIIDTQVKGAEEVGDLGDKAEETAGAFVKLQLQIRKTQKDYLRCVHRCCAGRCD